jgi:hypothetical protein
MAQSRDCQNNVLRENKCGERRSNWLTEQAEEKEPLTKEGSN